MPGPSPKVIQLTSRERKILQGLIDQETAPQFLVRRANIILQANEGNNNTQLVQQLGLAHRTVSTWRNRWFDASTKLQAIQKEHEKDKELKKLIIDQLLQDNSRSGAPPKFSAEEVTQIIVLACDPPKEHDCPVSHWVPRELAQKAIEKQIVTSISPRTVGRILNDADLKPYRTKYWLFPEIEDQQEFEQAAQKICQLYKEAEQRTENGEKIYSTDEKTGIQALGRKHPNKPMKPGQIEKIEYEYERNGTQCLIANFEVAKGQIISPTVGDTRNEKDFAEHIKRTIALAPDVVTIFIVDQLNTHKSESLVRLIAEYLKLDVSLGVKGKSGILKNMKTRMEFLSNEEHRIRFVYTPKHCSWLNQVELWFSILVRRLLKRSSFASTDELCERLLAFIEYFNKTLAKPFRWSYNGRLKA